MSKLQILRIKLDALLELSQKLYENGRKIFKEYLNAKKDGNELIKKYDYYTEFLRDVIEQTELLEDEIVKEECRRGLDK